MIWIRLILAAFLGAACSLVGGGAGMIRGAVLFVRGLCAFLPNTLDIAELPQP